MLLGYAFLILKEVGRRSSRITSRVYPTQANPYEGNQSLEGLENIFLPWRWRKKRTELSIIFCLGRRNQRVKSPITRTTNPHYCQKQKREGSNIFLLMKVKSLVSNVSLFCCLYFCTTGKRNEMAFYSAKTKIVKPVPTIGHIADLWNQPLRTGISNTRSFCFHISWNE